MSDAIQKHDPLAPTASTSVTDELTLIRPRPTPEVESVPSIALPWWRQRERLLLTALVASSPLILAICFLFNTGRDLTIPFAIGEGLVLLLGIAAILSGIYCSNATRGGAGVLSIIITLVLGLLGGNGMFWVGTHEFDVAIEVTDAKTGKPVPNALVKFGDRHLDAKVVTTTDRDGLTKFKHRFWSSGASSLVCNTGGISFSRVEVGASAAGYDELTMAYSDVAGFGCSIHAPPPPMVRIKLRPNR